MPANPIKAQIIVGLEDRLIQQNLIQNILFFLELSLCILLLCCLSRADEYRDRRWNFIGLILFFLALIIMHRLVTFHHDFINGLS